MALTAETILQALRSLPVPPMYPGDTVRIIQSHLALEDGTERMFPESRHRSARVRKKLIKRFGGEFRKVPCMWRLANGTIIAHPAMYQRVCAALTAR